MQSFFHSKEPKEPFGVARVPDMRRLSFIWTLKVLSSCSGLRHKEAWGHEKPRNPYEYLNIVAFCFLSEPLGLSGWFTLVHCHTWSFIRKSSAEGEGFVSSRWEIEFLARLEKACKKLYFILRRVSKHCDKVHRPRIICYARLHAARSNPPFHHNIFCYEQIKASFTSQIWLIENRCNLKVATPATLSIKRHTSEPPQLLPAPAVQPKQCAPVAMKPWLNSSKDSISHIVLRRPPTGISSIWLKSQS